MYSWCIYCNISLVQPGTSLSKKPSRAQRSDFNLLLSLPAHTSHFLRLPSTQTLGGTFSPDYSLLLILCLFVFFKDFPQLSFPALWDSFVLLRKLCFIQQGVFHSEGCVLLQCWELSQALSPSCCPPLTWFLLLPSMIKTVVLMTMTTSQRGICHLFTMYFLHQGFPYMFWLSITP